VNDFEKQPLWKILALNFSFTKRQLGLLFFILGTLGVIGILAIDVLNVGREGGIGPAQRAAVIVLAGVSVIGLTLIPLGDKQA
jgi:hypothetical protein